MSLAVTHQKVLNFYSKHPSLDFEKVNIMVVELLENIIDNKSLDNILAKQIVDNFDFIKQTLHKNKQDSMEEFKNILQQTTHNLLNEQTQHIQDKTKLVIADCIPKNNESISCIVSLTEHRLKEQISEIKNITNTNKEKQNKLENDMNSLIHKMGGTVGSGQVSEKSFENILINLYPSAEIINSSKQAESADYILKRENIHDIRFENKNYNTNVPTSQIFKFKRDMETNNSSGVMLCHNHGITSKNNFEFEIFNNNVYVYLHHVNYEPDKIRTAVDIIDNLKIQFKQTEISKDIFLDRELFAKINNEFIKIIERRDNIINTIKNNTDKVIKQLRDVDFPVLRDFIAINSGSTESKKFTCQYCGLIPEKNNLKGLKAHYRFCKEKSKFDSEVDSKSTESE